MYALLTDLDQPAEVRADRALVPRAVEESLRLEQPIANWGRTALTDADLDGHAVSAGCPVTVNVGAANHAPRQFPGLRPDSDATGVEMTGLHFRMPTRLPVVYTPVPR
jgi:cytochrome P450